jgi:SiaC family regulatory phosphoprotein
MNSINISATEETPEVILDAKKNIFKLSGRSFVQNSVVFYDPILKWFSDYFEAPNSNTQIELKFDYINSSSQKRIIEIILMIQQQMKATDAVNIVWYYKADDEDMLEKGQEFAEYFKLPFKFIPY